LDLLVQQLMLQVSKGVAVAGIEVVVMVQGISVVEDEDVGGLGRGRSQGPDKSASELDKELETYHTEAMQTS
ncbi:hypothetical protein KI387_024772, partial [Taxus chinensis]